MFTGLKYLWSKLLKKLRFSAIKNSKIHKSSKIEAGSSFYNSTMGKNSFCGYDCEINNADIGMYTSIGDNVTIGAAQHPYTWISTSPVFYAGKDSVKTKFSTFTRERIIRTSIGNDVWIGKNVMIKGGVNIGDGAVIGMGSVVTKNVLPFEIIAGVPAKHIKFRFDESTIDELLKLKWWDFSDEKLHKLSCYIQTPKLFIKKAGK